MQTDTDASSGMNELTDSQKKSRKAPRHIPRHSMPEPTVTGMFVKHFASHNDSSMMGIFHRDDYYVMAVLIHGKVVFSLDFNEIALAPGDALVVQPSQVHSGVSASDDAEGWMLGLSSEHLTSQEQEIAARFCLQCNAIHLPEYVEKDICNLFEIYRRNEREPSVTISLAASIKSIVLTSIAENAKTGSNRYSSIVVRLKSLMEVNIRQIKSPAEYASMLNISEVYLNEAVKFVTGLSISRFIRHHVVVQAKRMLIYTSMSAQEIAYELGYDDYSYFSRLFRKEAGISPNKFLKNLK